MRLGSRVLFLSLGLLPAAVLGQDLSRLPGTYDCIQRVPERVLKDEGIGVRGGNSESIGLIGQPMSGQLTLAADKSFTIALENFDEGTWEVLKDEKTKKPFLRFTGKMNSFDAIFQGEYGIGANEIGLWLQDGGEWWLAEFRKSAEPGVAPSDPYATNEAALASMFGQGDVKVDFAEVKKGSSSGVRVQQGAFSMGARFGSPDTSKNPGTHSDNRVVMTFLPDGRFTIAATLTGESKNGTYKADGSELRLSLEGGVEETWEIGRDTVSGKFAIRPAGSGGAFFFEVPLQ